MSLAMLHKQEDRYLHEFSQLQADLKAHEVDWLSNIRQQAMQHYATVGLPTLKQEEWRFTNIAPIRDTNFKRAALPESLPNATALQPYSLGDIDAYQLVFINGTFTKSLSRIDELPNGVVVSTLQTAAHERPALVQAHLGRHWGAAVHGFVALNTALMQDGAFIFVPKNVVVEKPIHLLFLTTAADEHLVTYPRNLIVAEPSSQLRLIESYAGLDGVSYFTNAVTEVCLEDSAVVEHTKLQLEQSKAFHMATTQVHQARASHFHSQVLAVGGKLSRNEIFAVLNGEGCETTLNGLYFGNSAQLVDSYTCIDHRQPHCNSHELYKGILAGESRGVFNGKIVVRPEAQKTNAKQSNSCLLLSKDAIIDTKPQLEIFADDVKCTHGATVGQLDANALFYLRSRGMDLASARSLLTYAFANEVVDRMPFPPLQQKLAERIWGYLPGEHRSEGEVR